MAISRYSKTRQPVPAYQLILNAILATMMILVAGWLSPWPVPREDLGFCIPSPGLWGLSPFISWLLNTLVLCVCGLAWVFLNKEYSMVKGIDHIGLIAFMLLIGANPLCSGSLSSGSLMLAATVAGLAMLFSASRQKNATAPLFALFSILSIGSMFQYSFLPLILFFFLAAIVMKTMRAKEIPASLLGIVAPYWCGVGLGIIPLTSFRLPVPVWFFGNLSLPFSPGVVALLINFGICFTFGILMSASNAMAIFAGNKATRQRNNAISLLLAVMGLCVILNYANARAYLPTFYFAVAVQIGNLFAYHHLWRPRILAWIFTTLLLGGFTISILFP